MHHRRPEHSHLRGNRQWVAGLLGGNRISDRKAVGYCSSHTLDETEQRKLLLRVCAHENVRGGICESGAPTSPNSLSVHVSSSHQRVTCSGRCQQPGMSSE
ncbi:hypothetical protein EVAR_45083_1 [Eumeta japonica]|uniref:Uncharacterized protein n=1 Tax=Eumeta variegata TaxID=151549 RepID=A0A4C1XUN2_EUMVA|nr:hypothetical protein EVAR_45083_1 [Eumeta japonica]